MYFTINNVKRAKSTFIIFTLIYILSFIQLAIFYIYNTATSDSAVQLFKTGFLIGVYGFLAGGLGIHYLIIKNYRHEMGNLETMGFSRFNYILQYWLSFILVSLAGFFAGIIIFIIIVQFFSIPISSGMFAIIFRTFINLFLFYNIFTYLFLFIVSLKDPFHLIKEKP